jgi:8-oxo-dGDP phosphatase
MKRRPGEWQKLSSKIVHQNSFYSVREDAVIKPDGAQGTYHVIDVGGSAFVAAVDDKQRVYLVRMHKYPINDYSVEFPGGGLDSEEPLTAAKRELWEEAGLKAKDWKYLGNTHPADGVMCEDNHVFLATGLAQTDYDEQLEEGIVETLRVPFSEAFAMIRDGVITDQQTIAALMLAAIELKFIDSK